MLKYLLIIFSMIFVQLAHARCNDEGGMEIVRKLYPNKPNCAVQAARTIKNLVKKLEDICINGCYVADLDKGNETDLETKKYKCYVRYKNLVSLSFKKQIDDAIAATPCEEPKLEKPQGVKTEKIETGVQ